jgi:hypothetical protein
MVRGQTFSPPVSPRAKSEAPVGVLRGSFATPRESPSAVTASGTFVGRNAGAASQRGSPSASHGDGREHAASSTVAAVLPASPAGASSSASPPFRARNLRSQPPGVLSPSAPEIRMPQSHRSPRRAQLVLRSLMTWRQLLAQRSTRAEPGLRIRLPSDSTESPVLVRGTSMRALTEGLQAHASESEPDLLRGARALEHSLRDDTLQLLRSPVAPALYRPSDSIPSSSRLSEGGRASLAHTPAH